MGETLFDNPLSQAWMIRVINALQNGGTMLLPAIEQQIMDRELERTLLELQREKDRIASEWAGRGFLLPDGVLTAQLMRADMEFANKRLDTSRDIAIKQAELEQENLRNMIQQTIGFGTILKDVWVDVQRRTFEASKALADGGLAVVKTLIERYTARVEAYKTQGIVYEAIVRAAEIRANIYKIEVEAAHLTVEVNSALIEIYKAQLSAVELLFNLFKTELQAAQIQLDIVKTQVEIFVSQVKAYSTQIEAQGQLITNYKTKVESQGIIASAYKSEVDAYVGEVSAAVSKAELKVKEADAKIANNNSLTQMYTAEIEEYKAALQGAVARVNALVAGYEAEIKGFSAEAQAWESIANVAVKEYDANITQANDQTQIALKAAEVTIANYFETNRAIIQAMESGAEITARIASSALTGVTVAAHVQQTSTTSDSTSKHYDESQRLVVEAILNDQVGPSGTI
jgi:hypothetical protein